MDHRCGGCVGTYGKEKREMQGYGEAIVPHLVEFQENTNPTDSGLIIQIHDSDGELVHTYEDQSSEFKYRIIIKDAPKKTTVWTVIGVDEDNWWNEYAPGMDCMREFAPGPYYDPSAQVNVLCTGKQVDDAMCSYLYDVMTSRQQTSNSVICIGAGVLGGSSWLNRQVAENFEKVEFRTDYPWGEVVQRIARRAAQGETQVIVEVPPEAQIHQTKQYHMLLEDEKWTSVKIDGCTHGQRMVVPGPSGIHTVGYCKVEWEYFAANVKIRPKLSDKCTSNHVHVCQQTMHDHADKGCRTGRTSQISRRLLNALKFQAPSDGRLVSMPANIPKGRIDRVVVSLDGAGDGLAEPEGTKGCARIQCREPVCTCTQEDELIQKLRKACRGDLRTPVLFVASLLRSGERPEGVEGSCVGGEAPSGGKYKRFRSVLKSLKRLLKKCAEFSNVYFSLDMPSSCSCWSWPELHALIASSKVKRVKVADHVDATGRLIGRIVGLYSRTCLMLSVLRRIFLVM